MMRANSLLSVVMAGATWIFSFSLYLFTEHLMVGRIRYIEMLGARGLRPIEQGMLLVPVIVSVWAACIVNGFQKIRPLRRTLFWMFISGVLLGWMSLWAINHVPFFEPGLMVLAAGWVPFTLFLRNMVVRKPPSVAKDVTLG